MACVTVPYRLVRYPKESVTVTRGSAIKLNLYVVETLGSISL